MSRYLAFFGDNYYPNGGMGDFLSDHEALGDAMNAIMHEFDTDKSVNFPWGHVYDTVNKEIVYKK